MLLSPALCWIYYKPRSAARLVSLALRSVSVFHEAYDTMVRTILLHPHDRLSISRIQSLHFQIAILIELHEFWVASGFGLR